MKLSNACILHWLYFAHTATGQTLELHHTASSCDEDSSDKSNRCVNKRNNPTAPLLAGQDSRSYHSKDEHEESFGNPYGRDKVWERTHYTLDEYSIAGIDLASFGQEPLFELYEDFDISPYIRGDEDWEGMLAYRNELTRPSLSFYVDKVARKRWLPTMGYPQPKVHFLSYAEELTETGSVAQESNIIYEALPDVGFFAAKPTHMSLTKGTWLVDRHANGTTHFSLHGWALEELDNMFSARRCADDLAASLHDGPDEEESWALKNVKPGLVVEERWEAHNAPNSPPHEFNIFTIWGRVWIGQWNTVDKRNRWTDGFFYRNGSLAEETPTFKEDRIPDWVPWGEIVDIAERLGAHKDMFRTDIFLGRPAGSDSDAPLKLAVSESEIFPTTIFSNEELSGEGARLWIAGYAMSIYKTVENVEVPPEYIHRGKLSDIATYIKRAQ